MDLDAGMSFGLQVCDRPLLPISQNLKLCDWFKKLTHCLEELWNARCSFLCYHYTEVLIGGYPISGQKLNIYWFWCIWFIHQKSIFCVYFNVFLLSAEFKMKPLIT